MYFNRGNRIIFKSSSHWLRELSHAVKTGKTVFFILNAYQQDDAATGSTSPRKGSTTYSTQQINNYAVLPASVSVRNARGRNIIVKDSTFKGLYDSINATMEYRVVFENTSSLRTIFAAKEGTPIGGILRQPGWSGALVLLPYFDFEADEFSKVNDKGDELWSNKALQAFHALVAQLVAVDHVLKSSAALSPIPQWLNEFPKPKAIIDIEAAISNIDLQIEDLCKQREKQITLNNDLLEYSRLLYETGKPLEKAIEKVLRLMNYSVETLCIGDLEIDHAITGPSGKRMIGESEGKDNSAIDISKFRQLETNIREDFEREEVDQHAKGLLFGNGFRLSIPAERAEQFTAKCLTNAKRFGAALIRTADLYKVAVYLIDHPDDESFKAACQAAIEDTVGGIVQLPDPPAD